MGHGLSLVHYDSAYTNGVDRSSITTSWKPFGNEVFDSQIEHKLILGYLYGIDVYQKPQPHWIDDYYLFDHGIKVIGCY